MELAARGVLTLVDHATPARLREAYLRLRACYPATEVIVDVRRLAELPLGATAILALTPSVSIDALDWLNLTRPVVSELRLSVVLWCEDGAAAVLAQRAPDFFDWISARVDCPPAPAAHAVAEVRRAICARASGIAWDGPGLEETLAAVRPGRPIRRVAVASYQSMIDALTSRERGWLYLEGIDTEFHLRRLRWAMAETRRRVIVFRRAIEQTAPGWWTVHARHASITEAVRELAGAGGTGRLAALTGLDPEACAYARFALRRGTQAGRLEELLATAAEPRAALQDFARQLGWTAADVIAQDDPQQAFRTTRQAIEREAARHARDEDPSVAALRSQPLDLVRWAELGAAVERAGDFEVAIRWLTAVLRSLPEDASLSFIANLHVLRGRSLHRTGDFASARIDLELAHSIARGVRNASMIAESAASLADTLLEQDEPSRARECLESALSESAELGDDTGRAYLLDMLAVALAAQGDLVGARLRLEQALSIKKRVLATEEDHPAMVGSLNTLGTVLIAQGDMEGARSYFERSLEVDERLEGPSSLAVVVPLMGLAAVHQALGDLGGARDYVERAVGLQRVALGSDEHPLVVETLVELARLMAADGELDDAQATLERALVTQQKAFGSDGQLAGAKTRRVLADVLIAKGDLVGAIGHLERALATLRNTLDRDDHPDIAATLSELERLRKLQGELQRAD